MYYASYPLRPDKLDWWAVIKIKTVGRVEVENLLDVTYQANDISCVHQPVDVDLEDNLEHPEQILEEVDIEKVELAANEEMNELNDENVIVDEENWLKEETGSKEEEWSEEKGGSEKEDDEEEE